MVREAFLQSRFGGRDARVQLLSRITECQVGDAGSYTCITLPSAIWCTKN